MTQKQDVDTSQISPIEQVIEDNAFNSNTSRLGNLDDVSKPGKAVDTFTSAPCLKIFPARPVQEVATPVHPFGAGRVADGEHQSNKLPGTHDSDGMSVISVSSHSDSEAVSPDVVPPNLETASSVEVTNENFSLPLEEPSKKKPRHVAKSHSDISRDTLGATPRRGVPAAVTPFRGVPVSACGKIPF